MTSLLINILILIMLLSAMWVIVCAPLPDPPRRITRVITRLAARIIVVVAFLIVFLIVLRNTLLELFGGGVLLGHS